MSSDSRATKKRKFEQMTPEVTSTRPTKRQTRSSAAASVVSGSLAVRTFPVPHHTLAESRKRGKGAGRDPKLGDRRIVEDKVRKFTPVRLQDQEAKPYLDLFAEGDNTRRKFTSTYVSHGVKRTKTGETEKETFGIIEATKGSGLTGRSVPTPKVTGMIEGVDDPSHPIAMSAVTNQAAVNKREYLFPENRIANQGGARVVEERGRDLALKKGVGNVAAVTRTRYASGSDRPNYVERLILIRSESRNQIDVNFGYSHDNDENA